MTARHSRIDPNNDLHCAVSEAISAWSFVEMTLTQIFCVCITPSFVTSGVFIGGGLAATNVFFSVESLRARILMIDGALSGALSESDPQFCNINSGWDAAKRAVTSNAKMRNRLAHWHVISVADHKGAHHPTLRPAFFDPRRHQGVRIHDIREWRKNLVSLNQDVLIPLMEDIGRSSSIMDGIISQMTSVIQNMRSAGLHEDADNLIHRLSGSLPSVGGESRSVVTLTRSVIIPPDRKFLDNES
ncbi:hypothetical protein [uncultured Sphingomonas sp.]|uniref:hypothetical protein n=1 Tax=uncultured Sphingomonas sp. TaxID=158754 RepID=UPI0025FF9B9D|nr:hypothetical protein [uncultured Sphingomonas sp.]